MTFAVVSKKAAESGFFRPRMILLTLVPLKQTLDFAAVSKKAAEGGFFRPRMIPLTLGTLKQTLDSARGGVPARGALRGRLKFILVTI